MSTMEFGQSVDGENGHQCFFASSVGSGSSDSNTDDGGSISISSSLDSSSKGGSSRCRSGSTSGSSVGEGSSVGAASSSV